MNCISNTLQLTALHVKCNVALYILNLKLLLAPYIYVQAYFFLDKNRISALLGVCPVAAGCGAAFMPSRLTKSVPNNL